MTTRRHYIDVKEGDNYFGLSERDYDILFGKDKKLFRESDKRVIKPSIYAEECYWLLKELVYFSIVTKPLTHIGREGNLFLKLPEWALNVRKAVREDILTVLRENDVCAE